MPTWLLKIVLNIVIGCLTRKLGQLTAVKHVEAAFAKVSPLALDINPAPWRRNDPNNNDPAHGGRPR